MNEKKDQLVELSQEELESVTGGSGSQPQPWIVVGTSPIVVGTGPVLKPMAPDPQPW